MITRSIIKSVLTLSAVVMATLVIEQAQAETIVVPNNSFELIYKPGSTTITADLSGGWTNGVGNEPGLPAPMNGSQIANFSDSTTGTTVDIPGWINAGAPWDVPPYDWTEGSGSVTRQNATPEPLGLYYFTANGGDWGNAPGGAIESDAPLGIIHGGTYTLSMFVNGPIVPVVLDLLANGVPLTPSSTVDPGAPYAWAEFSRTYDEASLTGHLGESLRIRVGWGPDATGSQSHLDNVTLEFENVMNPSPANGATVPVGDVDLSWTNLDPNFDGHSVYVDVLFGTEPNETDPDYDMTKVVTANPADPDRTTWTVSAPTEGTYYWQVNSYIYGPGLINEPNAIEGALWSFNAVEDLSPTVVIDTPDQMTWSGEPVLLDATVVDDDQSALTIEWTAAGGAHITVGFDPSAAVEDPTVTITKVPYSEATIVNAGFEDEVIADGTWGAISPAPGWSSVGDAWSGGWNPGILGSDYPGYGGNAPEGDNVAWAGLDNQNGGGMAQVLAETLTADTTYELTVEVGNSPLYYHFPGYKVQLLAGGTVLDEDPNTLAIASGTFETSTVTFDSTGVIPALVGEPLEIRLLAIGTHTDWAEVNFDDVRLTADPPFTLTGISTVELTVAVSDEGNPTPDTDTMEIDVYDNACQLARIGLGLSDINDFDENCIIDLRDFAVIAAAWLDDYAATGPVPK